MTTITLFCQGSLARVRVEGQITQGMVGIPVTLVCDGAWEGLQKTLKVRCGEEVRRVVLCGEEPVRLPFECLIAGHRLECGLDGWDSEGTLRIPTNWVSCGVVKPSVAECDGTDAGQPTPPVGEQIMERVGALTEDVNLLKSNEKRLLAGYGALEDNYGEGSGQSVEIAGAAKVPFKSLVVTANRTIPNEGNLNSPVSIGFSSGVTLTYPDGTTAQFEPSSKLYCVPGPYSSNPNVVKRDWGRGKDTLTTFHYLFTGEEAIDGANGLYRIMPASYHLFQVPHSNSSKANVRSTHYQGVSFDAVKNASSADGVDGTVATYGSINSSTGAITRLAIYFQDSRFSTSQEFKDFLREECAKGTPVEIAYYTKEFEADIPQNDRQAFAEFLIAQPECTVSSQEGFQIQCEWWRDFPTKNYIDWADALRSGGKSQASGGVGYVTPEEFGAFGDGYMDDTAAIQAAMNSGKVVVMTGNYRTTATIQIGSGTTVFAPCKISSSADTALRLEGKNIFYSGMTEILCRNGISVTGSQIIVSDIHMDFTGDFGVKVDATQASCFNNTFRSIRCEYKGDGWERREGYGFWLYKPDREPYTFCNHNSFYDCIAGFCGIAAYLHTYDNQDPTHNRRPMNDNAFYGFSPEGSNAAVRIQGFVSESNFDNIRTEDIGNRETFQMYGFSLRNRFKTTTEIFVGTIVGQNYQFDPARNEYDGSISSVYQNYFEGQLKSTAGTGIHQNGIHVIAPDKNGGVVIVPENVLFDREFYQLASDKEIILSTAVPEVYAINYNVFTTPDDYDGESPILHLTKDVWWPIRILVKPGCHPVIVKDEAGSVVFQLKAVPERKAVYTLHIQSMGQVDYVTKEEPVDDELELPAL